MAASCAAHATAPGKPVMADTLRLAGQMPCLDVADRYMGEPFKPGPTAERLKRAVRQINLSQMSWTLQAPLRPDVFQVVSPITMPDNTVRAAYMDCGERELFVAVIGTTDATRWYGPFNPADFMSAHGGAAPPSR